MDEGEEEHEEEEEDNVHYKGVSVEEWERAGSQRLPGRGGTGEDAGEDRGEEAVKEEAHTLETLAKYQNEK